MTSFTPWSSLLGGMLIGASASLLLLYNGRIAGVSGILGKLVSPSSSALAPRARADETRWRAFFVGGLLLGGVCLSLLRPGSFGPPVVSLPVAVVAGLLVGFGTRLGSGCTSGHGVCGISRFSARSFVATCTFLATGMAAAFVTNHLLSKGAP